MSAYGGVKRKYIMKYAEVFKEYLKWFVPIVVIGTVFWFLYRPITVLALFLACLTPLDRTRVAMIKKGYPIPATTLAWKIIGTNCIFPFVLALLVGGSMEVKEGVYRANNIISSILVFVLPVFIVSCICYLNNKTWARAQVKYGVA